MRTFASCGLTSIVIFGVTLTHIEGQEYECEKEEVCNSDGNNCRWIESCDHSLKEGAIGHATTFLTTSILVTLITVGLWGVIGCMGNMFSSSPQPARRSQP
jgi:hypothetical protein